MLNITKIDTYIQEVNEDEYHALGVSCIRIIYVLKRIFPYIIIAAYVYTVISINNIITTFFDN